MRFSHILISWYDLLNKGGGSVTRNKIGAPGTIRTCDRLVRSQVLYPAELRARKVLTHLDSG
jgi:hypothetical protein